MFNEGQRAAWVEIQTGNIRDNYLAIRRLAQNTGVIACVKADAYGHGIVAVSRALAQEGVEYLGVATLEEAANIRNAGIDTDIVLLSPIPRGSAKEAISLGLIPVVGSYEDAHLLSAAATQSGIGTKDCFISLETGMGRLGFMPTEQSYKEIAVIASLPGLRLLGFFSHFATADEPDLTFARTQLAAFNAFTARLAEMNIIAGKRTMANTAALMALPSSRFDIIRPGIGLYGLYPSETMDKGSISLKPAMSLKARIVNLKKTPPAFSISYGSRFVTRRESLIATLPLGYGDGLARGQMDARLLVRGRYAPIVGTICMDLCMADVTDIPGVSEYDEVVLMGEQSGNHITAEEIAKNCNTIVYEVVCRFGQRLPHRYL